MVIIRTLRGASGTKFQVIMRDSAGKTTTRSFRRLTDAKAWRTAQIALHHVVRSEDWPLMPLVESEFELRPFDFFDVNPTATEAAQ
jgi:Cu2+-containing amine oxidase